MGFCTFCRRSELAPRRTPCGTGYQLYTAKLSISCLSVKHKSRNELNYFIKDTILFMKARILAIALSITALNLHITLCSQKFTPSFKHFFTTNSMIGTQCYSLEQDRLGYILATTNLGLSLFDGNSFEILKQYNSNRKRTPWKTITDNNGVTWIYEIEGSITFLSPDKRKEFIYPFNDILQQNPNWFFEAVDTRNRALLFSDKGNPKVYHSLNAAGAHQRHEGCKTQQVFIKKVGENFVVCDCRKDLSSRFRIIIESGTKSFQREVKPGKLKDRVRPFRIMNHDGEIVICFGSKILLLGAEKYKSWDLKDEYIYFCWIAGDHLWVQTSSGPGGTKGYSLSKGKPQERYHLFEGMFMHDIIEDKDGGIWFCTSQNGIFYTPDLRIRKLDRIGEKKIRRSK